MLTCTFFGHRDAGKEIQPALRKTLIELIENKKVYNFYVGNHGGYDCMVKRLLMELKEMYPIRYAVVLSCLPVQKYDTQKTDDTILPDGIELVPPKFAINYRNKWMIRQSDVVVTYVTRTHGGAWQFKTMAERQGKMVIELNK